MMLLPTLAVWQATFHNDTVILSEASPPRRMSAVEGSL